MGFTSVQNGANVNASVVMTNCKFEAVAPDLLLPKGGVQTAVWGVLKDSRFLGNRFLGNPDPAYTTMGESAIALDANSEHCTIANNEFLFHARVAVRLDGRFNVVSNNILYTNYEDGPTFEHIQLASNADGNLISNNLAQHFDGTITPAENQWVPDPVSNNMLLNSIFEPYAGVLGSSGGTYMGVLPVTIGGATYKIPLMR